MSLAHSHPYCYLYVLFDGKYWARETLNDTNLESAKVNIIIWFSQIVVNLSPCNEIMFKIPVAINTYYYTSGSLWKSDWSRAFNQFTIACELDMINAIPAADMSSSTSAWLLSPLECSPKKQNGWTLRFCFWGWIMWKMCNKTIIEFGFRMTSWIIKTSCLCYLPKPKALIIHDNMLDLIQ